MKQDLAKPTDVKLDNIFPPSPKSTDTTTELSECMDPIHPYQNICHTSYRKPNAHMKTIWLKPDNHYAHAQTPSETYHSGRTLFTKPLLHLNSRSLASKEILSSKEIYTMPSEDRAGNRAFKFYWILEDR